MKVFFSQPKLISKMYKQRPLTKKQCEIFQLVELIDKSKIKELNIKLKEIKEISINSKEIPRKFQDAG